MKKGLVEFDSLSGLSLADVLERIENSDKLLYGNMTINDLSFAGDVGKLKIWEFDKKDVFGWGAYVIFENGTPIYVGAASKHFSHRFQSHAHYDPRNNWGWNALVKKLTNSADAAPTEKEWQKGKNRLLKCEIVRIYIPITNDDSWCYALERELMIGFKHLYPEILNTNVKKVGAEYLERNLGELVNHRAVHIQNKRKTKNRK